MMTIVKIILIAAILILAIKFIKYGDTRWWKKFNENPRNFPFKWKGKTLWYSRSCAVAVFVFCKDKLGQWCVLANQRGKGAPDYNFFWNSCCGYVDWNESCEGSATRELKEEMGIDIPLERLQFYSLNSDPVKSNHQNITARYFVKIDDMTTDDPSLTPQITGCGEEDEVADVAWIPVANLKEYNWAFDHNEIIEEIFDNAITDKG